ncbi:nucleotidyl transferase AbiEii/AbiGii toxin family protein [Mesorhizobium sp. M0518]|uniref:nucleotidyl transferase AbiEii/AbiGii toxin family protein n=1 Tax=Mesorhizobium sp. M0518 TaxID=2956956 RepID=UPI00333CE22E
MYYAMLMQPHQVRWIEHNLIANDIAFVVTGGVAVKFYHPARETEDVDLFTGADPGSIDKMVASIPALAQNPKARAELLDRRVGHFKVGGEHRIDVLTFAPALVFSEAFATAEIANINGVDIPILSRALLIAHKTEAGDPKDLADVALLQQSA